jgi:hypothetical protein
MAFDWTLLAPATKPSPRNMEYIAKDRARNQIVLFGGAQNFATAGSYLQDTWTYDGSNWAQHTPAHVPGLRTYHMYVYDETRQNVVMFGGMNPSQAAIQDTWTWDGTDWTQHTPTSQPSARFDGFMCWDNAHGYVLLFGGATGGGATSNQTWTWDGSNWTQLTPASNPGGRQAGGKNIAWDPALGQVILHGGSTGVDTWTWNGTTWSQLTPVHTTGTRQYLSLQYCESTHKVVGNGAGTLNITDLWDGTDWSTVTTVHGTDQSTAAICEGLTRGSVLMWMGQLSASWKNDLYYGYDTAWTPPGRSYGTLVI